MLFGGARLPQQWNFVVAGAASLSHRCRCGFTANSIGGPWLLLARGIRAAGDSGERRPARCAARPGARPGARPTMARAEDPALAMTRYCYETLQPVLTPVTMLFGVLLTTAENDTTVTCAL